MQLVREKLREIASIDASYSSRPRVKILAHFSSNAVFHTKSYLLTRTCTKIVSMTRYGADTQWTAIRPCGHSCEKGSFMRQLLARISPTVQHRYGSHSTRLAPSSWTKRPTSSQKRCSMSIASTTASFAMNHKGVVFWMHMQMCFVELQTSIDPLVLI